MVSVEVITSALEGEIELKFTQATASDEAGDPTIFSFGMGGLFDIGTTGISDESRKIVSEYFALHQNYPNPFAVGIPVGQSGNHYCLRFT